MGQTQQQELALASVVGGRGGPDCSQHPVFFFFFPHRDTDIYDDVEIYGRFKWTAASS